jgi:hypothetical protein
MPRHNLPLAAGFSTTARRRGGEARCFAEAFAMARGLLSLIQEWDAALRPIQEFCDAASPCRRFVRTRIVADADLVDLVDRRVEEREPVAV